MNNRRGWLRIVEATVAIVFVLSVLFVLYTRERPTTSTILDERARSTLEEMALNASLRKAILEASDLSDEAQIATYARAYVPSYLSYELRVCAVDDVCGKSYYDSHEVFAAERIIAADVQSTADPTDPRKVRLFIWYNGTA